MEIRPQVPCGDRQPNKAPPEAGNASLGWGRSFGREQQAGMSAPWGFLTVNEELAGSIRKSMRFA